MVRSASTAGLACALTLAPLLFTGCVSMSNGLGEPQEKGTKLNRALWSGAFRARWDSYQDYFESCESRGSQSGGFSHRYSCERARISPARRLDLLRAIRADLLELAADSGVTVERPIRDEVIDGHAVGFEFDYSQAGQTGRVRVKIKPAGDDLVDVVCTIDEPPARGALFE
jgi:hypothetical protein